ncbi:unnamed protein product [Camellia sinensis]
MTVRRASTYSPFKLVDSRIDNSSTILTLEFTTGHVSSPCTIILLLHTNITGYSVISGLAMGMEPMHHHLASLNAKICAASTTYCRAPSL